LSVLVVGSVALDSVETPRGSVNGVLGGSAVYFATAASLYTKVNLVAVAGTDFPTEHIQFLAGRGIDTAGLEVIEGKTFRWAGHYDFERNITETLKTELNVFADFHPILPPGYQDSDLVFLANIDPELQCEVLEQVSGARLKVVDTMNFWIRGKGESLSRAISAVDIAIMDESEARLLAQSQNTIVAARNILNMGPKTVIVKRGQYGAVMLSGDDYFIAPAYPVSDFKDPTGAGDSFAGGFLGYLDEVNGFTPQMLRQAVIHGTAVASFTISEFSIDGLRSLTRADIEKRYYELQRCTHFEDKECNL
jgi:sugar/nucleoside kinase (ribokinase family)